MRKDQYDQVVTKSRLPDGSLFPMPITISLTGEQANRLQSHPYYDEGILLKDPWATPLAILRQPEIWVPDLQLECQLVYGTTSLEHPYVQELSTYDHLHYLGGRLEVISLPTHYSFSHLYQTPAEVKAFLEKSHRETVVGFQTRNPMHRSHLALTQLALKETGDPKAILLLTPAVGLTQSEDVAPEIRIRCYQHVLKYYPDGVAFLVLIPLAMRMAGPREALWHAIIRRNYGCTHFIVGRGHAEPSTTTKFYQPYQAHQLLQRHQDELGIRIIFSRNIQYVPSIDDYQPEDQIPPDTVTQNLSGSQLRTMLRHHQPIPRWFSYPEVVEELRPAFNSGFCLYLVGLPSSGKSTLARAIEGRLLETEKTRRVTLLDGDKVRTHLSAELTLSSEDRSKHVRRIGYVASEIVKHGGIVLVANIAPFQRDRQYNRHQIGQYIEVYLKVSPEECWRRDPKGLYDRQASGIITGLTGVDAPFEEPTDSEIVIEADMSLSEAVEKVWSYLQEHHLITKPAS